MKMLGIGLPRTGNTSLALFLRRLGYETLHYNRSDGFVCNWHDNDAIVDYPMCVSFPVLMTLHKELKAILTIREDLSALKSSTEWFRNNFMTNGNHKDIEEMESVLEVLYGSVTPSVDDLWDAQATLVRFAEPFIEQGRCLILPLSSSDKAQLVCDFLEVKCEITYPHENARY